MEGDRLPEDKMVEEEIKEKMDIEFPETLRKFTKEERRAKAAWKVTMTKGQWEKYQTNEKYISQVAWLRYRPENKKYFATFDCRKAKTNFVERFMSCKWVAEWLSIVYYRLAIRMENSWLHIPAGNARDPADTPPPQLLSTVVVQYNQGSRNLCLVKSLASALHYMELHQEAGKMNTVSNKLDNLGLLEACRSIKQYMKKFVPCIGVGTQFNTPRQFGSRTAKTVNNKMTLKDLVGTRTEFPTVVIPKGRDGSVNHAVCVVDDLIFDSTQAFALKLTLPSFHWICGDCGCEEVYYAIRFQRSFSAKPLQRKMKLHR